MVEPLRGDDPQRIGAYRLLGRLGTGGMGRVYLARSDRGRTVAVKLVRAELAAQEEFRTRFRREVRAALQVGGKWTAPVLDADTEAEIPWVATGYVAGPSLQQVVKDYGPLPERSVTVLAAGLAHALSDIHTAGLVHRDLKPSNVMITIDGPRVIDFGIARALETVADGSGSLTQTGDMVGSPAFMSPEQVRGDRVTPACDVFCLGSVLAYAATGLQPFGAASSGVHAQMFRIVQEPPDLAAVPEGLRPLVTACLTKEPAGRPSLPEVLELIPAGADGPDAEPWLPGAIVAQLGRHAVQLLELEAEAEVAGAADPTLVAPQRPADLPAPAPDPAPQPATPAPEPSIAAPAPIPAPAAVPAPAPEPAPAPQPAPAPPAPRRGGRGALVAVLALLAVIAGGTTAYVVVKASGGRSDRGAPPAAPGATSDTALAPQKATAPPTATPTTGAPAGTATSAPPPQAPTPTAADTPTGTATPTPPVPVTAPDDLVGTWRASYDSAPGVTDTRTLTVRQDGSVELTGERTDGTATLYHCEWHMSVTDAGPPARLSPSLVADGTPAASCQPGGATTVTLLDGTHLRRLGVAGEKDPPTYEKAAVS
ncbi:serine/threonine-protein kinase [Actinacidiphila epipremni]|uniref:Serine/threonine protein kinase n=1 Tax=Actinacidiphila epipremni TaxID=2053013 RepID=A0ABX0ZN13_9ACTN|nr:serine/threonine-protein kinase [Actinacidiphila epipremni]NJP44447.1 serine/threonine protein kinase [Actinacidiphila epipremni]